MKLKNKRLLLTVLLFFFFSKSSAQTELLVNSPVLIEDVSYIFSIVPFDSTSVYRIQGERFEIEESLPIYTIRPVGSGPHTIRLERRTRQNELLEQKEYTYEVVNLPDPLVYWGSFDPEMLTIQTTMDSLLLQKEIRLKNSSSVKWAIVSMEMDIGKKHFQTLGNVLTIAMSEELSRMKKKSLIHFTLTAKNKNSGKVRKIELEREVVLVKKY